MKGFNFTESEGGERKLWTGVMPVEVTKINPTHDELKEIYGENAKPPTYVSTDENGNRKVRIDFYVNNTDYNFSSNFSLYIVDQNRISEKGNTEVINSKAQHTWVADPANISYEWFDNTNVRIAKDGETKLYDMLVALINANKEGKDTNLVLENFEGLFNNDVSELRNINKQYGKGLRVLLGVKDGVYQDIYTGYFGRTHISGTKVMEKNACDPNYGWSRDFQNSMELKEYTKPTPPSEPQSTMGNQVDTGSLY